MPDSGEARDAARSAAGLVCPLTRLPLSPAPGSSIAGFAAREARPPQPVGPTAEVLMRSDGRCAYPVVDGIPVLLAPERLVPPGETIEFDLEDPRYAEAYEEMDFYDQAADGLGMSGGMRELIARLQAVRRTGESPGPRPEQRAVWLDAGYDAAAQNDAYEHLAPFEGKRVLQLGGKASHAAKFLLAGASSASVLSPMIGEARFSRLLAEELGVHERLECVVGLAEELPWPDGSFDAVYSGGCLHHTVTGLAFAEIARVLRPDGRFAAAEPWRAPLYAAGTAIFGKREVDVHCRPLDSRRISGFDAAFETTVVRHHGALTRYPLLALMKLGMPLGMGPLWRINGWDDTLSSWIPGLRSWGSSVAILAVRGKSGGKAPERTRANF